MPVVPSSRHVQSVFIFAVHDAAMAWYTFVVLVLASRLVLIALWLERRKPPSGS